MKARDEEELLKFGGVCCWIFESGDWNPAHVGSDCPADWKVSLWTDLGEKMVNIFW